MNCSAEQMVAQLLPVAPEVIVTDIVLLTNHSIIRMASTATTACCPACQQPSKMRHSRYVRTLQDLAWGTHTVQILLTVRKFRCPVPSCPRKVFMERLPTIMAPYARQTKRCQKALRALALALGGRAAAALAKQLGLLAKRDTFLRLLRQTPLPIYTAPRIIGIDDWALRRGNRFGTIVVDLERQRPIALLPDRQPATVVAWLRQHPTVLIVSRDRADGYADAIRRGAPQARQVADKWHLLKNLTENVQGFLQNKHAALKAALPSSEPSTTALAAVPLPPAVEPARPRATPAAQQRYHEQYHAIHALHQQHLEIATIARQVGVSRTTVYNYLRLNEPPVGKRPVFKSIDCLQDYKPYLLARWAEGCRNARQLLREIQAQGYSFSGSNVNRYLTELRRAIGEKSHSFRDAARQDLVTVREKATRRKVPSARQAARLFTGRAEYRKEQDRQYLQRLCEQNPEIKTVYDLVGRFTAMVRQRDGSGLQQWLADVQKEGCSELKRFANGIQADQAAVLAGLNERWSQGQVEGHINRLKYLKRQSYGRASLALLQQRVLHRPDSLGRLVT